MNTRFILVTVLFLLFGNTYAKDGLRSALHKNDQQFFIENKGQWDAEVLFLTQVGGIDVWITRTGVQYDFYQLEPVDDHEPKVQREWFPLTEKFDKEHLNQIRIGHRIFMKLKGSNKQAYAEGKQKQKGYYNYFIGNDTSRYVSNVGLYKEVMVKDIYDGIDIRYYFDKGSIRYDYMVHAGTDPSQIIFEMEGSDKAYISNKSSLVFTTCFGEMSLTELRTYQLDNKEVVSGFVKNDNGWSIEVGNYDKTKTLIIDPLIYSTYLGGSGVDYGHGIVVDDIGNSYVTGYTNSVSYFATLGAYQVLNNGVQECFVTKLNSAGSGLIYSTYIGGSDADYAISIGIDSAYNVYLTGQTLSSNFPTTLGSYQTINAGSDDVFVTKLSSTGSALLYSTFIGGTAGDYGLSIAIDESGHAFIAGVSAGSNYDITIGAYQTLYGGGISDVFVTKLNQTGTSLVYSTYLGGIGDDYGYSIAIDSSKNAYITGLTSSINYDTTVGAYQTALDGNFDAFISKLDSSGTVLSYSTLLGGASGDYGSSIKINAIGNAIVTGYSFSPDFDTTVGAYQCYLSGQADVFISQLNNNGSALLYSTYLGGAGYDRSFASTIDSVGNAYITGWTSSTDFDVTALAFQPLNGGVNATTDAFVTKIELTPCLIFSSASVNTPICEGETLILSVTPTAGATYYWTGPNGFISALQNPNIANVSMAANGVYTITVTSANGCTNSDTVNVLINPLPSVVANNDTTICEGQTLDLTVTPTAGATYNWTGPNGFISALQNASIANVTMAANGAYTITIFDVNGCSNSDTTNVLINPLPTVIANNDTTLCEGQTLDLTVTPTAGATYNWSGPNGFTSALQNPSIANVTMAANGDYTVDVVDTNGCSKSDTTNVKILVCTGIAESMQDHTILIFPNPNNGTFTLQTNKLGNYELIDVAGRIIHTYEVKSSPYIIREKLATGMYFIREKEIRNIQGSRAVEKVIIE